MASNTINLLDSDDEDDLPASSGLKYIPTVAAVRHVSAVTTSANTARPASSLSTVTPAGKAKIAEPPQKKQKTATKAFSLLWICTHGKGRSNTWRKKDLQVMGIYPSKAAAEEAKKQLMTRHLCCGHGDIMVGGTWEDEIDLVIREAPLHL